MDDKRNIRVSGKELTVYFYIADGAAKPCYYCGKLGHEQLVGIESVVQPSGDVSPKSKLFKLAKDKMERDLFHGRGICRLGSPCEEKYHKEQYANFL
ncbi:MAG: hypothetical protein AAB490_00405 [Patescibacteria group bacterium]